MRIRKKPWAKPELDESIYCIDDPISMKNKWHTVFNNDNPVHIELGCGKGGFISKLASSNPQINYIAMDIKNEMLALANRNIKNEYEAKNLPIDNIKIAILNIERIDLAFEDKDLCDRIYINFCNPWPKKKHKKRRLTHTRQLNQYKSFLKIGGEIRFKTDDDALFEESLEYFNEAGYEIKYITHDLHNSDFTDNIMTEHEKMFSDEGIKIKFLIAVNKG